MWVLPIVYYRVSLQEHDGNFNISIKNDEIHSTKEILIQKQRK